MRRPRPIIFDERLLLQRVGDGTLSIDSDGRIWRHFLFRANAKSVKRVPIIPAIRAEHKSQGYCRVVCTIAGQKVYGYAHRLVWQYFFGQIPDGLQPNHRNAIRDDNRPSNLELTTQSGNIMHAFHVTGTRTMVGEANTRAILTEVDVLRI